jgi:hypothetical protein
MAGCVGRFQLWMVAERNGYRHAPQRRLTYVNTACGVGDYLDVDAGFTDDARFSGPSTVVSSRGAVGPPVAWK